MADDTIIYPSPQHEAAAKSLVFYFSNHDDVEAVLLTGSCARQGKATRDSCIDVSIVMKPEVIQKKRLNLYFHWENFYNREKVFSEFRKTGRYSHIDLEIIDCTFSPENHGYTSGPDSFELAVGNALVYSRCLFERGPFLKEVKKQWLPYYAARLRNSRLKMVLEYCHNNLDHIPLYVERGLLFQSFSRFYHAFGEFLQALFICRRVYPIAYDKWIQEQLVEILQLPDLYNEALSLFNLDLRSGSDLLQKHDRLKHLIEEYIG